MRGSFVREDSSIEESRHKKMHSEKVSALLTKTYVMASIRLSLTLAESPLR